MYFTVTHQKSTPAQDFYNKNTVKMFLENKTIFNPICNFCVYTYPDWYNFSK